MVCGKIAQISGKLIIMARFGGFGKDAQPVAVDIAEQTQRFGMIAAGGCFGVAACFIRIFWDVFAQQMDFCELGVSITAVLSGSGFQPLDGFVGVGWEQDFRKGDLCRRDVVTCRDVQVLGGLFKVRCHALTELVLQSELPIGRRKSLFGGKLVELV